MYVCICKGVTDKQLKCAINQDGLCSRKALRENLGVGDECGKCNQHLKSILNSQLEAQSTCPAAMA